MANKPLQSIKFPGLPDKYTVPQMDSNFDGVSGKIPDSKKVHDEIDSLKEDLSEIASKRTVTSKNLFNPTAEGVREGYYLDTSGNPTALAAWNISDFIYVGDLSDIVASIWRADGTYFAYGKLSFLHTYNSEKKHIAKVWDVSSNGVYTVGENVSYIKFCWKNNDELANNRKMMVEAGNTHSDTYEEFFEPYSDTNIKPTAIQANSIDEEKLSAELQEKINSALPDTSDDIVFWGDSLTYSQGATGDSNRYPYLVGQLANKNTYNWGMPGANSMDISGLQGGMPIYLAPFTLPADTSSVVVSLIDANGDSSYIGLLHHMPREGWVNSIQAMGNTWLIDDIPVMLIYSSPNMKVKRITADTEAVTFDRPVKITSVQNYAHKQTQVFWVGTNDAPTTPEKAERLINVIKNMVRFSGNHKYLVLGLTVKSYADACNALLAQAFGNNYIDVKDYLIKYGLADNDISPTEQDTTDIANNVVPESLRTDSVHLNDAGYVAVAKCVYQHGKWLGYWG